MQPLTGIVSCVKRKDIEEVHVVMKKQHRVAIEEAVHKLNILVLVSPSVGLLYAVIIISEFLVEFGRDKEVWDYLIAFGLLIAQTHLRRLHRVVEPVEDIKVPLDDIACIGILLIHRLAAQFMSHFIVFGIANTIGLTDCCIILPTLALSQANGRKQVVNYLAVILPLVHAIGQWGVAHKFVNDGLKDDIEILDQQILPPVGAYKHLLALIEEGIAELP